MLEVGEDVIDGRLVCGASLSTKDLVGREEGERIFDGLALVIVRTLGEGVRSITGTIEGAELG